jgi:hypothetical protein
VADGDESLLDVFVNIRPDPNFQDIIRTSANEAIAEYARIFSTASIPSPRLGPPNVSGGGSGGGGGGSSGGGGGGGRGGLAQEYRDASRALEDLQRNLRTVNREASLSGIVQFDDEVRRLQDQLSDLVLNVRRQTQDRDLLGIQASLQYVEPLRQEILRLFQDVQSRAPLKEQFDFAVAAGREQISTGRITNKLEASLVQGLSSGEMRQNIARLRAELEQAEFQVRSLSLSFDGTQDSVDRVVSSVSRLSEAQENLRLMYQEAQVASVSMNTLSNNAYQLGQAFEDFAVGFSLNGIAGGIRGAANNVAFLLNSLSQSKVFTDALTKQFIAMKGNVPAAEAAIMAEKFSTALPLVAGIGSALAIIVLPALVEWLETLNDIETKTRDISDELKRSFQETDFEINLRGTERSLQKTIADAGTVRDILEQIRTLSGDADQKREQIGSIFGGFEDSGGLQKVRDSLREVSGLITDQIDLLIRRRNAGGAEALFTDPLNELMGPFGADTSLEALSSLKKIQSEVGAVSQSIEVARQNTQAGIFDSEQIAAAEKGLLGLKTTVGEFAASADSANEKFGEEFASNISTLQDRFAEVRDIAKEIDSIVENQLTIAVQGAVDKTNQLADRQQLIRNIVKGTADEQAEFLMDVRETSAEYSKLISDVAEFYSSRGKDPSNLVNQLQAQEIFRSENEVLRDQESLIESIRNAEEKLASLRDKESNKSKRSQNTNFEAYVKGLQENALSLSPVEKNTQAIDDLSDEVSRLNFRLAQRQATLDNLGTQFSDPGGFADRQRAIEFARPFDTNQALMNMFDKTGLGFGVMTAGDQARNGAFVVNDIADAVNKGVREAMQGFVAPVVGEQRQTTDAVRKLNVGARAQ